MNVYEIQEALKSTDGSDTTLTHVCGQISCSDGYSMGMSIISGYNDYQTKQSVMFELLLVIQKPSLHDLASS